MVKTQTITEYYCDICNNQIKQDEDLTSSPLYILPVKNKEKNKYIALLNDTFCISVSARVYNKSGDIDKKFVICDKCALKKALEILENE